MSAAALDCRLCNSRCLRRSSISTLHRSHSSSASATICKRMSTRSSSKEWMMESAVVSVGLASEEPPLTSSRRLMCRRHEHGAGTSSAGVWIDRQDERTKAKGNGIGSGAIVLLSSRRVCGKAAKRPYLGRNARCAGISKKVAFAFRPPALHLEAVLANFCATHQEIDG